MKLPKILHIINRFFHQKFKTRVKHYARGRYIVQWCSYRIIPTWHSLHFWFDQGHPGGTECWSLEMWDYASAEHLASKLKSENDVREYYKPLRKKESKWREKERAYWEKNVPYSSKIINN